MICTNKRFKYSLLCLIGIAAVFLTGCKKNTITLDNPFPKYVDSFDSANSSAEMNYLGSDLCVASDTNFGGETVASYTANASGLFNVNKQEVMYANNIYDQLAPASTTKILTAYIILSNCNINDAVTVSDNAVNLTADASTAGLKAGDIITVENLLYGLMLPSGNDAAVALAEYYSGSVEAFADEMNKTAMSLGATHSHFCNPSGLPQEEHYTCVYDLYLIFNAAIKIEKFVEIINTAEITVSYTNIQGSSVNNKYENTNRYLNGAVAMPEGISVIGGKTGTTAAAGNCLVLLSKNSNEENLISIVLGSSTRSDLYILMSQMLSAFGN